MIRIPLILKLTAVLAILIALAGTLGALLSRHNASGRANITSNAFRALQIKGQSQ